MTQNPVAPRMMMTMTKREMAKMTVVRKRRRVIKIKLWFSRRKKKRRRKKIKKSEYRCSWVRVMGIIRWEFLSGLSYKCRSSSQGHWYLSTQWFSAH